VRSAPERRLVDFGDPEVEDLHLLRTVGSAGQHHVLGFDVPMNDPGGVRGAQGGEHLARDAERTRGLERSIADDAAKTSTFDVLEDEEVRAVREATEVRGRTDPGVTDVRCSDRLALEARDELGGGHRFGKEDLEGEPLPHVQVFREVHRTHPTFTELPNETVPLGDDFPELEAGTRGLRGLVCCRFHRGIESKTVRRTRERAHPRDRDAAKPRGRLVASRAGVTAEPKISPAALRGAPGTGRRPRCRRWRRRD
jgi:hypothetical protein